jgi:hypothetical protein
VSARYRTGGERGSSITTRAGWPFIDAGYRVCLRAAGTIQLEASMASAENWSGTKRPHYFLGQVLTADDLNQEQQYLIEKHRRHLRTLHGFGIVQGLQVRADGPGESITIEPGIAIDSLGREILLNEALSLTVPKDTSFPISVVVEYAERLVGPTSASTDGTLEPSRIEEGCRVVLVDDPCESDVAVARLITEGDGWRVDASFVPARV